MQGLGRSLPRDQPRDKAASRVGTYLSSHRTSPNFSLQSISASYSSPTYRQPWKPSRTWVSCSALKQEGCSAAWSWQGGTGDPEQGEAFLGQSPCAWATSTVSIQHQDKTQPATSRARVLPAPAKGSGIHAANAIGSTRYILQSIAHPQGITAEGAEQARHTGSMASPTWEPGAPRGPGGPGRAWGRRAPSEPCAAALTAPLSPV